MEDADEDVRKESIKRYIEGERQINICRILNQSKSWPNNWIKRYQTLSPDYCIDNSEKPNTIPNKVDEQIENVVVRIRESLMKGDDK